MPFELIESICSKCGFSVKTFKLDQYATYQCQSCGAIDGYLSVSDPETKAVELECSGCHKTFVLGLNRNVKLTCPMCNTRIIKVIGGHELSSFIRLGTTKEQVDKVVEKADLSLSPNLQKLKVKVVIPYYEGNPFVDKAVKTWVGPDTVFAITDENSIPPGCEVSKQIFTPKSGKDVGCGPKTKPFLVDLLRRLIELYPDQDYYGLFNSDIILPPGTNIRHLLPRGKCTMSIHHRYQVIAPHDQPVYKSRGSYQEIMGKDGFFATRAVCDKLMDGSYGDPLLGAPGWDDSLVIWAWETLGKENVDIRWGEIWHPIHELAWTYNDKDAIYNFKSLKRISRTLGMDWGRVYTKYLEQERNKPSPKPKKVGIIQPGRLGDVILVLPIAKFFHDAGYKVVWPVMDQFLHLFDYVPYVQPIGVGNAWGYQASTKALETEKVNRVINLGIGFGRDEVDWINSGLRFDEWKYKEADVPFEFRYNVEINRNHKKEEMLTKELMKRKLLNGSSFTLVHNESSFDKYQWNVPGAVQLTKLDQFSIFDWIGVIEHCASLFCVDSCIAVLANSFQLCVGRRFIHHWPHMEDRNERRRKLLHLTVAQDWREV